MRTHVVMNKSIPFEPDSTAALTNAGSARHAGIMPIRTAGLPGRGASGGACWVTSVVPAAAGIISPQ